METKNITAKVLRISAEIAQQAADFAALNRLGSVSLLVFNDICIGIDTSNEVAIGQTRRPVLNIEHSSDDEELPKILFSKKNNNAEGKPFNKDTIYDIVKQNGPISAIQIGDMLEIGRKSVSIRCKISQILGYMRKKGLIERRANDNAYVITDVPNNSRRVVGGGKVHSYLKRRVLITQKSILDVLREANEPLKTADICDRLGLDRKSTSRSKVTKLLRHEMVNNGSVKVNEKGGGHSTYEYVKNWIDLGLDEAQTGTIDGFQTV